MRPPQWYKQGVMLIGIVFAKQLSDPVAWRGLVLGIISMTILASATYIFNDIFDRKGDRAHPQKCHRPIASGQVSIALAASFALVLVSISLLIASLLDTVFLAIIIVYLVQNWLYSFALKEIAFVDVLVVAFGFVLRAVAGVVVIDQVVSPWLLVCTFLLALVLAFGKRRHEIHAMDEPSETRKVLSVYTKDELDQLLVMVTSSLLLSYSVYVVLHADPVLMLSLPMAFFGGFRYHHLVRTTAIGSQPKYLVTDRQSVLNLVLWTSSVLLALYTPIGEHYVFM